MLSNKCLKCLLFLFLIGSTSLLAMDYSSLNRGDGLELVLCATEMPTEVLKIIYEKITEINEFVLIPGGDYEIGSPEKLHGVTLSPFTIMKDVVTQEQYALKMGRNPSYFQQEKFGPQSFKIIEANGEKISVLSDFPVENVYWFEAKAYADALSKDDPKYNYRLPTEAELEVAFRGGTKTAYVSGDEKSEFGNYVHYRQNSNKQTHPVKSKWANGMGVSRGGGVWEWTGDRWVADYVEFLGLDPTGPKSGSDRVIRGGSWNSDAVSCRSEYRGSLAPELRGGCLGFRLVRTKK